MSGGIVPRMKTSFMRVITRAATSTAPVRALSRAILHRKRSWAYRTACRATSVDARTVVFECYAGRAYACSPRALFQAMLADVRFSDFEFVWVFRREDMVTLAAARSTHVTPESATAEFRFGAEAVAELARTTIVEFGSSEYQRAYARAGTWISNYILPAHLHPRDGQRYVQTWHGTPLKRLGCDISPDKQSAMFSVNEIHARYHAEGSRFTWLLCPSQFARERLSDAFALSPQRRSSAIIESGYPRNDALAHPVPEERIAATKRRLGVSEGCRVLLYAPTFRDDEHSSGVGYTLSHTVDFDLLRASLGDEYTVLFRGHYLLAQQFDLDRHEGFVVDVSSVSDINDLYLISDVLVTDYSSVFFDFANLLRPIVFYMPDVERYRTELRGFYLELENLPGPVVHTNEQLAEEICATGTPDPARLEHLRHFRDRFAPLDDGHAANRVLEHIFQPALLNPAAGNIRTDIPSPDVL